MLSKFNFSFHFLCLHFRVWMETCCVNVERNKKRTMKHVRKVEYFLYYDDDDGSTAFSVQDTLKTSFNYANDENYPIERFFFCLVHMKSTEKFCF